MACPFFVAVRTDHGYTTRGTPSCRLGHPVDSPNGPQGLFAEWSWDPARGELRAHVDPLGFYSLFYHADDKHVMVAPSPLQLIAQDAPAGRDQDALAVFFHMGMFVENQTPFSAIRVLPPNGTLEWTAGKTAVSGANFLRPASAISRADAIDGFIQLFRQAMRRCLENLPGDGSELVLPLSGGRDSRHILFELQRLGALPARCITFNISPSGHDADTSRAGAVANAVGVRHEVLPGTRSRYHDQFRTVVVTHLCADEHYYMMPLRDFDLRNPAIIFDGIGGDVLTRNRGFTNAHMGDLWQAGDFKAIVETHLEGHLKKVGCSLQEVIGARRMAIFGREIALQRLVETLQPFAAAADPHTAFLFWNRTRREISLVPTAVHAPARRVFCPYLDLDLVRFLMELPREVTRDGAFHDTAIATAFPQYANVPYYGGEQATWKRSILRDVATRWQGIAAAAPIAPWRVVSESWAHLQLAAKRVPVNAFIYRAYLTCLEAAGDARGAQRLLDRIERMERTPPVATPPATKRPLPPPVSVQ